jgi:hypothetical protein
MKNVSIDIAERYGLSPMGCLCVALERARDCLGVILREGAVFDVERIARVGDALGPVALCHAFFLPTTKPQLCAAS